ncbi:MAG: hypothetical protein KA191_17500 [Verrucomicrobia bacterium]|jgi:hypothetical protein|nr:hypothetical protein [Verrucomicrobiota bacterium]MDI9381137.1 hypothetical protein [Verrucomicrobiota bacterium]NMD20971.1 hypothetical protein [Verrucomicrobiota bacterium]HOA62932.1 hypothetical protein [Verrucomicrobiota bacterium]HOF49928.1 hypothetical protein [Verrucomicrobiota bacterium]
MAPAQALRFAPVEIPMGGRLRQQVRPLLRFTQMIQTIDDRLGVPLEVVPGGVVALEQMQALIYSFRKLAEEGPAFPSLPPSNRLDIDHLWAAHSQG